MPVLVELQGRNPNDNSTLDPRVIGPLIGVVRQYISDNKADFDGIVRRGTLFLDDILVQVKKFQVQSLTDWNQARSIAKLPPCSLKPDDDADVMKRKIRVALRQVFPKDHINLLIRLNSPTGLPIPVAATFLSADPRFSTMFGESFFPTLSNNETVIASMTIGLVLLSLGSSEGREESWTLNPYTHRTWDHKVERIKRK